jgi:hypothetical protein
MIAACEHSFSKLKLIQKTIFNQRKSGNILPAWESSPQKLLVQQLNYDDIIDSFTNAKVRKVHF